METVLSVVAIVISVISGGFAFYVFTWTAHRDRKQATLDAYNRLQKQALDHLNFYSPSAIAEIIEDRHSDEYKRIGSYIARIEHFCVGVNQRIYDREIVYELAEGYLDGAIKTRIEPVIDRKNQYGSVDYYENIHKVYAWMAKCKEKREREA